MPVSKPIRILIAEDDDAINSMLRDLLSSSGYQPESAFSGTEALMLFNSGNYDLVLLDLMLPGKSGGQVLEEIKQASGVPVIALTAVTDKESVVSLLKAGADDYITKPFDNDVLLARIDVQLRNSRTSSGGLTFRDIVLDAGLYEAFIGSQPLKLSKREFEILKLLMQNPNKVFTKNNLYESVWKEEFLGDDNTINVHISKIRAKIAALRPGEEYISTVWGIGFKLSC